MTTYSPQYIAESFVKQYYDILTKSPADLYKFYLKDASFAFTDANQAFENVVGTDSIRQRVALLGLMGSTVNFSNGSVDAQLSESSQILVVVTGTFTAAASFTAKPFTNTFILVGMGNSYFVSNSVFRFIALPSAPAVTLVPTQVAVEIDNKATPQRNATEMLKSMIETSETTKTVDVQHIVGESLSHASATHQEVPNAVVSNAAEVIEETNAPASTVHEEEEEVPTYEEVTAEAVVSSEPPVEPEVEETSAAKSYSDIVKRLAAKNATAAAEPTSGIRVVRTRPAAAAKANPTVEATPTASSARNGNVSKSDKAANQQFYSVYITSLPENVSEAQIATVFTRFGTVTQVDLARGRKYGFVKFETVASMQAALDNQEPLEIDGVRLQVEHKTSPKYKEEKRRPKDRDREEKRFHKNGEFRKDRPASEGKKEEGKSEHFRSERRDDKNKSTNESNFVPKANKNKVFPRK